MLAAQVQLKYAQKVKEFLLREKFLNLGYKPLREGDNLLFPLNKRVKVPFAKIIETKKRFS